MGPKSYVSPKSFIDALNNMSLYGQK